MSPLGQGLGKYTAEDLRQRATHLLLSADDAAAALHWNVANAKNPLRPAAVLIPVIDHKPEATVLLTLRAAGLSLHAGQIAFPGGKLAAGHPNPAETALREAEEEVGLSRQFVELIGFLDCYHTNKGFCIAPAVGVVTTGFDLQIEPREVVEAFEVPLGFLMTESNHERCTREVNGEVRPRYTMAYQNRFIWGVTAGILRSLYEQLYR